jgi:hypothetical protein
MASKNFGKDDDAADPIADKLAELDRLIEEQKARLAALPAQATGLTGNDLKMILDSQRENQKALVEATRQVRHSNADHEHKSAFSHPEGDLERPKAKFRFKEVFHNGHREREDDLTPAEIDAYNQITHSCEARGGRWTATVKNNRLMVTIPCFTLDERMDVPSLPLQLLELAQGERAVTPDNMAAELIALRKAVETAGIVIAR